MDAMQGRPAILALAGRAILVKTKGWNPTTWELRCSKCAKLLAAYIGPVYRIKCARCGTVNEGATERN